MTDHRRAFTLVELSIVLVIIGLIVGGILAGKSLMKSQSLRNALEDAKTYAIAIQLFKEKYGALPGDMPNAERIWGNAEGGAATDDCLNPETSASTGQATCNGNGNGLIEELASENFRAWQQLAAGDFISIANLTGVHGAGGASHATPGVNVPRAGIDKSGFSLGSFGVLDSTDLTRFEGDYDNEMIFGKATTSGRTDGAVLTPAEAYEMDKKVDDAMPGLGYIRAPEGSGCATSTDPQAAAYDLASSQLVCYLHFVKGFQARPQ